MVGKRTALLIAGVVLFCYNPFIFFVFLYAYMFYFLVRHRGEIAKYFHVSSTRLYLTAWDNLDELIRNKFQEPPALYIKLRNAFNIDQMKKDQARPKSTMHQLRVDNHGLFCSILGQLNKIAAAKHGYQLKKSEISLAFSLINNEANASQCDIEEFVRNRPEIIKILFEKFVDIAHRKRMLGEVLTPADIELFRKSEQVSN